MPNIEATILKLITTVLLNSGKILGPVIFGDAKDLGVAAGQFSFHEGQILAKDAGYWFGGTITTDEGKSLFRLGMNDFKMEAIELEGKALADFETLKGQAIDAAILAVEEALV